MMPLTLWLFYLCHHTILCLLVLSHESLLHCQMFYGFSPPLPSKIRWLTDDPRGGYSAPGELTKWCRGGESPLLTCSLCCLCCSPGCVWLSRLRTRIAVSCPHTFASGLILSGCRIWTSPGWTSWSSCWPISLTCQSPSGRWHNHLVSSTSCFFTCFSFLKKYKGCLSY